MKDIDLEIAAEKLEQAADVCDTGYNDSRLTREIASGVAALLHALSKATPAAEVSAAVVEAISRLERAADVCDTGYNDSRRLREVGVGVATALRTIRNSNSKGSLR